LNRQTQNTYLGTTTVNYPSNYLNRVLFEGCDSRLTQVSDPSGTYSFTFDNMGRLTGTTTSYAFLTGRNFTTAYSYDAASNRTGFTDPESGPKVVGNNIPSGTAIATFDNNGLYPNNSHGNNSEIYIGPAGSLYPPNSILILDRWPGQNAQVWPLRPNAKGTSDRSTAYFVITVPFGTKSSCGKYGNW